MAEVDLNPVPASDELAQQKEPLQERGLGEYTNNFYSPGRSVLTRLLWYYVSLCLFESGWLLSSRPKRWVLKLFGAQIGKGLVIHPNVRIKYPWKLTVGNDCWIGREVWIDNLDEVTLESDVCLSQQSYLCTGSHDHYSPTFELKTGPIVIEHGAWSDYCAESRQMFLGSGLLWDCHRRDSSSTCLLKSERPAVQS